MSAADAVSVTDGGSFAPGTKTHWKKNGEAKRAHCSSVFLTISEHCQQIVNAAEERTPRSLFSAGREDGREGGDQVSGFKGSSHCNSEREIERGVYGQVKRETVGGDIGMSQFSHAVFKPPSTTTLAEQKGISKYHNSTYNPTLT